MTNPLTWLRRRIGLVDTLMTLNERVGMIGGGPLASSVALAAFLSLFPLLLVGIAVVGFFSADDVDFANRVVEELGLEGKAADTVMSSIETAQSSRQAASMIGLAGLLWAGLGVVASVSNVVNAAWQVKGRGLTEKLRELTWLIGVTVLLLASFASAPVVQFVPGPAIVPAIVVGLLLGILGFLWTFTHLTNVHVPWRAHLPGAIAGGIGLELLKQIAGYYVPRMVSSSSALYGSIGVVFALLAWFVLSARLLVFATVYNVLRWEREHGTVTVEIQVPHVEGEVPLDATRGGAVATSARA